MSDLEMPQQPQNTLDDVTRQPLAVIALRHGDCSLESPLVFDQVKQQTIVSRAQEVAEGREIPLVVPRGLEALVGEECEVELISVKSKSDQVHNMKATKKYLKRASREIDKCRQVTSGDGEIDSEIDEPIPIIVVAYKISLGAVRRNCDKSSLDAVDIIDCFNNNSE